MGATLGPQTTALLAGYGFELDEFQQRATAALDDGRSVLVAAPTGAGKTVVAEYAVADALDRGLRAFYTTPIKALSNQKFGDLRRRHGAGQGRPAHRRQHHRRRRAGGGDDHRGAAQHDLRRPSRSTTSASVVLDEVHYLQDTFRGPVWEEVIVHLPEHVQLVCLSATVSNADDIGDWLTTVRGPTDVVVETERPVEPRRHLPRRRQVERSRLHLVDTLVDGRPNPEGERFDADREAPRARRRTQPSRGSTPPALVHAEPARVLDVLADERAAAGDRVRLQPGRLRRRGEGLPRRRRAAHDPEPSASRSEPIVDDHLTIAHRRRPRRARTPTGGSPASRPASPRTTPGRCRRSRRRSRPASAPVWSRSCSPPRRSPSASTCRPDRW